MNGHLVPAPTFSMLAELFRLPENERPKILYVCLEDNRSIPQLLDNLKLKPQK
jgi:hypothetical protein